MNTTRSIFITSILLHLLCILSACNGGSGGSNSSTSEETITSNIEGLVQKGPFVAGASVTIYELDKNLAQTGKVFSTVTLNNKGKFNLKSSLKKNSYFEIVITGHYYDEVAGSLSQSPISLRVLSESVENEIANVNVLTHLESIRVRKLIDEGYSFNEAKGKATIEILEIFGINTEINDFKKLDITSQSEANAALLYVSSVVMNLAHRNSNGGVDAELIETLTNIADDISEDGLLDSAFLKNKLMDSKANLDLGKVVLNLQERMIQTGGDPSSIPMMDNMDSGLWSTIDILGDHDQYVSIACATSVCYLLGRNSDFVSYNISSRSFQKLGDMPFTSNFGAKALLKDNYIYLLRGNPPQMDELWRYSIVSNTWFQLTSPTYKHTGSSNAIEVAGKIYVFKGNQLLSNQGGDCEVYDIDNDTWSDISASSTVRAGSSSLYLDGKIYLFGGAFTTSAAPVEVYDISNNSWSSFQSPFNLNESYLIGAKDGVAFIVTTGASTSSYSLIRWDILSNNWQELTDVSVKDENASLNNSVLLNGYIYSISARNLFFRYKL